MGLHDTTSTPRAAVASTMRPRKALPQRAGSREPLANQTFANPASAQRPRGPGSTRSRYNPKLHWKHLRTSNPIESSFEDEENRKEAA